MVSMQSYLQSLEEERRMIQVFQRQLPLSYQILTRAIEMCKRQLFGSSAYNFLGQSDSCERTSSEGPALEELVSSKRAPSPGSGDEKSDWLRSVQLWTQSPMPAYKSKERCPKQVGAGGVNGSRRSKPKVRRCWSSELHQEFLHALKQLGGSELATPKQIREMMKVDGLTNDEVKSHLQVLIPTSNLILVSGGKRPICSVITSTGCAEADRAAHAAIAGHALQTDYGLGKM